jgi:hypothetical protein
MFLYQMAMSLFHLPDQLSHPNRSITGTVQPAGILGFRTLSIVRIFPK